jgi:transposase InsO family protein
MGLYHFSKTVARIMKELGFKATQKEKFVFTTDSNHDLYIYPNLLNRQFSVDEPNQVWVSILSLNDGLNYHPLWIYILGKLYDGVLHHI